MRLMKLAFLAWSLQFATAWAADIPAINASAFIEFNRPTAEQNKMLATLEKTAEYRKNECRKVASKSGKGTSISCAKFDGAVVNYLLKENFSSGMELTVLGCATGCTSMRCPPPTGSIKCCKQTATGYQVCQ